VCLDKLQDSVYILTRGTFHGTIEEWCAMEECKLANSRPVLYRWRAPGERKGAPWVYLFVGALCILWWTLPAPRGKSLPVSTAITTPAASLFSWDDITPSKSLEYHDCGDGFQCTRLEVPMDYNRGDTTRGRKFALAVVRIPAKVPIDDPRYGGAMLINPGKINITFREERMANMIRWPRWSWNTASILIRSQPADNR
jgi:hypothetical protein